MTSVRRAKPGDCRAVAQLIEELELAHNALSCEECWVGEVDGDLVAVAQLTAVGDAHVVSSVGVQPAFRRQGVARALVSRMLESIRGEVYLFTLLPEVFSAMGFELAASPPAEVEAYRRHYECDACQAPGCVCMRWTADRRPGIAPKRSFA